MSPLNTVLIVDDEPLGQETLTALRRLSETGDPAISESARWALSRIQSEGNHSSRAQREPRVERRNGAAV